MNRGGGGYPGKREETYSLVTNASGDVSYTFVPPFKSVVNIQPVCMPPVDSLTRVRVVAKDLNGFTLKTERNTPAAVALISLTVALAGTENVPGVNVDVLAIGY